MDLQKATEISRQLFGPHVVLGINFEAPEDEQFMIGFEEIQGELSIIGIGANWREAIDSVEKIE